MHLLGVFFLFATVFGAYQGNRHSCSFQGGNNRIKYFDHSFLLNKVITFRSNGVADVLDTNWTRILGFNDIYTVTSHMHDVEIPSLNFLRDWWGINISGAPPKVLTPTPVGYLVPFVNGDTYYTRVSFDARDPEPGKQRNWIGIETGYLVVTLPTTNYTVPDGYVLAGRHVGPNEIIFHTTYNLLDLDRKNKWDIVDDRWRLVYELRSEQSAKQIVKTIYNQSFTDQFVNGVIIDECGRRGTYLDMVYSDINALTGDFSQSTLTQAFWPEGKMNYPSPLDS